MKNETKLNIARIFLSFVFLASSVVIPQSSSALYNAVGATEREVEVDLTDTCNQNSEVWTNWDRKPFFTGLFELAQIRESLNENNLIDSYANKESLKILNGKVVECDESTRKARTIDGTCTNLDYPAMGAKGVAFGRNVPLKKVAESIKKGITKSDMEQIAEIAENILGRKVNEKGEVQVKPVPFLNFLITSWLQFMNHDWFFHGKNAKKNPYNNGNNVIPATAVDSELQGQRNHEIPENKIYANAVTHWWDGSQIYGSDLETAKRIRSFEDGKMTVDSNGHLPTKEYKFDRKTLRMEDVGFSDNWWLGLGMLHNLFVLEHNAIAEMLKEKYPDKGDQWLYDKARLINAAVMAKIHTVEWTPAILPSDTLKVGMMTNWYGGGNPQTLKEVGKIQGTGVNQFICQSTIDNLCHSFGMGLGMGLCPIEVWLQGASPYITNHATEFWKMLFGEEEQVVYNPIRNRDMNSVIVGMVGENTNLHSVPYTLTEDFVAVYRMHPLLPETLTVKDFNSGSNKETVGLEDTRHEGSINLIQKHGMENLFYSFGRTHPGAMALRNYPRFLMDMEVPENPNLSRGENPNSSANLSGDSSNFSRRGSKPNKINLAVLDVLRDRERGIPRYNEFRRSIGLQPIRKFEDLFEDEMRPETKGNLEKPGNKELLISLKKSYNDDVEQLDLLVGTLGEQIRPKLFGFGETAFQIFVLMATRRLQADRFYTVDYNSDVYTQEGIDWVDKVTMKSVILRHYSSLEPALRGVENAFNPWNDISKSLPEKHSSQSKSQEENKADFEIPDKEVRELMNKINKLKTERPSYIRDLQEKIKAGDTYYQELGRKEAKMPCGNSKGYVLDSDKELKKGIANILISLSKDLQSHQGLTEKALNLSLAKTNLSLAKTNLLPSVSGEESSRKSYFSIEDLKRRLLEGDTLSKIFEALWGGKLIKKTQDPDKNYLINNLFSTDGGKKAFEASVYYLEGSNKSTINIDYSNSPYQLISNIRDEIRQVDDHLYLGKAFYKGQNDEKEQLFLHFALDFSESKSCEKVTRELAKEKTFILPLSYKSDTASNKRDYLWKQVEDTEYQEGKFPKLEDADPIWLVSSSVTGEIKKKMDYVSDVVPKGWKKFIHSKGSIAKVKFVSSESSHPFTGLYKGTSYGLMRLSLTNNPHQKKVPIVGKEERGVAPGIALKLFVTGHPSQDISLLTVLEGQGENYNFFSEEFFSNIIPKGKGFDMKIVHTAYKTVSQYPERLAVSGVSEWTVEGKKVTNPNAPIQLFFVPVYTMMSSTSEDIREKFHRIPKGSTLFKVYGHKAQSYEEYNEYTKEKGKEILGNKNETFYIGEIVTDSEFKSSSFGDEVIFFKHKRFEFDKM